MWELLAAFLLGCLWTRTYYARIKIHNVKTDWMNSINWLPFKWYKKLHLLNCELCPKHFYCETYKVEKSIRRIEKAYERNT